MGVRRVAVLDGGTLTTVQDLGRPRHQRYGLAVGGAVDRWAAAWANRLVDNPPGAAVLEATWMGPHLQFEEGARLAIAGADMEVAVDGVRVEPGAAVSVRAGAVLTAGRARRGFRMYLAVDGGIATPRVLGSRSLDLAAGVGGPPLKRGMWLPLGAPRSGPARRTRVETCRLASFVRVTPGPAAGGKGGELLLRSVLNTPITVSWRSDRAALRGLPVHPTAGPLADVAAWGHHLSIPMVTGAVQVTPSGERLVLLASHGTLGGYPVPAVVIQADWPTLAQAAPDSSLRFQLVDRAEAVAAWARMRAAWPEAAHEDGDPGD